MLNERQRCVPHHAKNHSSTTKIKLERVGPSSTSNRDRWCELWNCEMCRASVTNSSELHSSSRAYASMIRKVQTLNHTIDSVHGVQLTKLSTDLSEVKAATDQIVKQNEEILRRIDLGRQKAGYKYIFHSLEKCRKRNVNLWFLNKHEDERKQYNKSKPIIDSSRRHRVQRKREIIHKLLVLLNERMYRSRRDPRRKTGNC